MGSGVKTYGCMKQHAAMQEKALEAFSKMGVEGMQQNAVGREGKSVRQNIRKNSTPFSRGYSTSRSSQQLEKIIFNMVESKKRIVRDLRTRENKGGCYVRSRLSSFWH
jgi:hypothetical protein